MTVATGTDTEIETEAGTGSVAATGSAGEGTTATAGETEEDVGETPGPAATSATGWAISPGSVATGPTMIGMAGMGGTGIAATNVTGRII